MTNFFGSVMETIHTDSTYKAPSIKSFSRAEIKMPLDQPANDNERRILADSNGQDQISNPKKEVTFYIPSLLVVQKALFLYNIVVMGRNECQEQQGAFRHLWNTINDKVEKIEDVDSFVLYGLLVMLPVLLLPTLLSW